MEGQSQIKDTSPLSTRSRSQTCTYTQAQVQPPSHHPFTPTRSHKYTTLRHGPSLSYNLLFLSILIIFLPICSASIHIEEQMVETPRDVVEPLGSTFQRLARSGVILVDQSPPPKPVDWTLAMVAEDLQRRQDSFGNPSPSSSAKPSSSSKLAPTSTAAGGIATASSTENASPLPSAFDSGFSANISSTCASFMSDMLSNSTFKSCLPFSLLLQNSVSFFQAQKSLVRITQTLDAMCAANVTSCTKLMSSFATNITTSSACGSDVATENPLVDQARLGLLAYKPMYQASCLKNPSSNSYCFADAITNATNPSDTYIYHLPLNITLPAGSRPNCHSCLQNTMAVYGAASADRASALASDYVNAAMQVNVNCGPNFVNASLAAPLVSASSPSVLAAGSHTGLIALVVVFASWLL